MAIDFPSSPSVGQQYSYAGIIYTYTSQGVWSAGVYTSDVVTPIVATMPIDNCGGLYYASPTALSFLPHNGDRIKIAGTVHQIPAAGIAGLGNTGVYVNGVAGQNLAGGTVYYVYAFNNGGTITGDFSTTSHGTSGATGNEGVEIKSGDNTRTLIGMVRTDSDTTFFDGAGARWVLSWFNRRNKGVYGASTAGASSASGTFIELTSTARAYFLTWGEESVPIGLSGSAAMAVGVGYAAATVNLDGAASLIIDPAYANSAAPENVSLACVGTASMAEGSHYITPFVATSGAATWYVSCSAMVRG